MKRLRRIIVWVVLPLVLVGSAAVAAHFRVKAAAERHRSQLRARGEKLTIAANIPVPPTNSSGGAAAFTSVAARLPSLSYELSGGAMKMLKPGRARVGWRESLMPTEKATNLWPKLRAEMETRATVLADLRAALAESNLWFHVNYNPGFDNLSLQHLMQLKRASQWLAAATLLHLHEQRPDQAWEDFRALLAIARGYGGEPLIIAQVIRSAILAIAASATWEALEYPGWRDDQLAELQSAWSSLELVSHLAPTLAMERACVVEGFSAARHSLQCLSRLTGSDASMTLEDLAEKSGQLLEDPKEALEELLDLFPRRWSWKWWCSYEDEIWLLQFFQANLTQARQTETAQAFLPLLNALTNEIGRLGEPPRSFLVSRALSADVYVGLFRRQATAEAQRRIVTTAIAIKRFEATHGRLPANLPALVPEFLSAPPSDPSDGEPLRYRAEAEGRFLLYSIGLNGIDEGGDPRPLHESSQNVFWINGKDWVWPMPASEEQVREHNAKLQEQRSKRRK